MALGARASSAEADEGAKARDRCRSWTATARMTAEAWLDGELPSRYAAPTLAKAATRLDDVGACGGSGRLAAALGSAVSKGDAREVKAGLARLTAVP